MSPILVWNMFKVLTCTQTNMNIHVPIYVINIGVPVSDHGILFGRHLWCLLCTAWTATIFKAEKNETTVANSGLGTVACQYSTADMAYRPHFKQWEKRLTTDIKHDLTFGSYQAVPATVLKKKRCSYWRFVINEELESDYCAHCLFSYHSHWYLKEFNGIDYSTVVQVFETITPPFIWTHRNPRSVWCCVGPVWVRLPSVMCSRLAVSLSSLLTPTFYHFLKFLTGKGLSESLTS